MTGETYRTIYGETKIDTDTIAELYDAHSSDDKYILYFRIRNRIIDESFVMLNTDGEINTSDLNQTKRDFALIYMTLEEVRNMVYNYIASKLTETFGGCRVSSSTLKRVNEQVEKFMDYYEHKILPERSILSGKEL